ncbi:Deoxyuridine 5'-triphosphate nucleotidohydrolase [Jeotgalibaca dankookensis]|uniref:dUTP diphosphatase n=1 Tax=Jeotgalibaca dankookensis TaxID=708126 RepID=A0A1S6IRF9_9LACT|nr:dUTP diphosphatase [Jeotgalibaca dankookensis]AQS54137.1 Deoxyuridine 5'-triphosphate nucleotidohydrolase [Jeotgalibaca dankookensis]
MRTRGFEIVSKYQDKGLELPKRATKHSAGYDFQASEEVILPSIWNTLFKHDRNAPKKGLTPVLVPTGIKAYMQDDEYLQLTNRSSNPIKHFLILPNGVGVVDADYYNNDDNEGEIFFQLLNYGLRDKVIKKGDRIGQGIFMKFLKVDDEAVIEGYRLGGFGSSDQD